VSATKKKTKRFTRFIYVIFVVWAITGIGFASVLLLSCAEEECLVWGENCTQQYKLDHYGTTDIYCCEGQCADHGSGILTCGY
jgi:hypothetical protein